MSPTVSFVVPCYKLSHLLADCLSSIFAQTYGDFEVIVVDDESPDDVPSVLAAFPDRRLRYVRNDQNLGHIRTYNRGVSLAAGRYLWLISADDRLRRPCVLERFVAALEAHPEATFVFCPAVLLVDGVESTISGSCGPTDRVERGADCLKRLAAGNFVPAPAAMARTSHYHTAGLFPPDLSHCADWYMWSVFALRGDVVYLAEPMIDKRIHDASMSSQRAERPHETAVEVIDLRWRMLRLVGPTGRLELSRLYLREIANDYAWRVRRKLEEDWSLGLTLEEFEVSIRQNFASPSERSVARNAVHAAVGDFHYERRHPGAARRYYVRALRANPRDLRTVLKYGLARMGPVGRWVREAIVWVRG